ncbi:AAA family ATPase [Baaleninema simplex]|uniref:AAA family ATPase n=1 Tax=Baaleninema simplex TaxID=2862350 RepID=UPI0003481985|nr:AAA family ATPase [Baaleninema simplex]
MLQSFQIKNFRLFKSLNIDKLNRINLIVGKNNAGKSAFLEAIQLYISNADPLVLLDLIKSRQETWISEAQIPSQNFTDTSIRHLFSGHKLPLIGEPGILLGEINSETQLHIATAAYQSRNDNEVTIKRKIEASELQLTLFDEYSIEIFLVAEESNKTRRLFRLDRDIREIRPYGYRVSSRVISHSQESDIKSTWQLVSTENISERKLAALWDLTSLTDLENEVISALRLIENRVSGIAFVEDVSQNRSDKNRIPLVKIAGRAEPLPLKSMGDGMTRLFNIILALVNAKNGILLIDEFENGLHWSVQPKVWDIVFQLSKKLDVQVFATTHSRDCVEGFDRAWNQYPELGAFFRLDIKNGDIRATEYTSETLTDAMEMDVEVR